MPGRQFVVDLIPHSRLNDRLVIAGQVILRYFALVHFDPFGEEVGGECYLLESGTDFTDRPTIKEELVDQAVVGRLGFPILDFG